MEKLKITHLFVIVNPNKPISLCKIVWCPQFGYVPGKEFVLTPALHLLLLRVLNAYFTTALLKQGAPRRHTNEHTSPSNKNNKPTCGIETKDLPYKMDCPFESLQNGLLSPIWARVLGTRLLHQVATAFFEVSFWSLQARTNGTKK